MDIKKKYTRFGNYYIAMSLIPDRAKRAEFGLAIDEFMFEDKEPQWEPDSLEYNLWNMIIKTMENSKRMSFNGLNAAGKGTGPRPSMRGNQNARKNPQEEEDDDLHLM